MNLNNFIEITFTPYQKCNYNLNDKQLNYACIKYFSLCSLFMSVSNIFPLLALIEKSAMQGLADFATDLGTIFSL